MTVSLVVPVLTPKWLVGFFRTLPAACEGLREPVEVIILDNSAGDAPLLDPDLLRRAWGCGFHTRAQLGPCDDCEDVARMETDVALLLRGRATSDLSFGFAFQTRVVYHDPPVSFHACWNAGVRLAVGDVVIVVNDDVLWGRYSVTRLWQALQRFDLYCCYPTPAVCESALALDVVVEPPRLVGPPEFRGWCQAWTRGGLEAVGPFDESFELFYGDDDAWARLADAKRPARQVHSSLVYHLGSQSVRTLGEEYIRNVKARDAARFAAKWQGKTPRQLLVENGL